MSDPKTYDPEYSFSGFQASSPATPLPATKLDAELSGIAVAISDHVTAIKDVRRADGALKNNIVTYDSLSKSLQLTFDPTNGDAVAAAIAVAQAAATAASGSATTAAGSATNAANSAAAAAASASGVNLALYLSKAGNLAGIGNVDTARGNISAMKTDASDATGRLAPTTGATVTDWNSAISSGWYSGTNAANQPPGGTLAWLVEVIAQSSTVVMQVAHNYAAAVNGADAVLIHRRYSYDDGSGNRVWTAWAPFNQVSVGAIDWFATTAAPPGYLKLNGALLSRATYPALWNHANNSGNIVSEASWSGGNSGAFSTGDLSTTFRIPDARGEFFRAWDDGRGVDSARVLGARQADMVKDHTHQYSQPYRAGFEANGNGAGIAGSIQTASTGGASFGGGENRPRNIPLLACIKF